MAGGRDRAHADVDVLQAEEQSFERLIAGLTASAWAAPTPAAGWDIRDSVSHLADTEEIAHDTVIGGERTLADETRRRQGNGGFVDFGVSRGRAMTAPGEIVEWWRASAQRTRSVLRSVDVSRRIPWGLGMSWRAFVTARLMEHWAHGLDVGAAAGAAIPDTERLQPIGWLCYSSLRYAFGVAGIVAPPGRSLRIQVAGPNGEDWSYGPTDATDTIRGPAGVWCRRAVQRISVEEASELAVDGPLAALAVRHARAFL